MRSVILLIITMAYWLAGSAAAEMVLVGGATGHQGNAVVDELLERGYTVRCLTRKPEGRKALRIAGRCAELVQGDYSDPASLDAAMKGVNKVFFYSGYSRNEVAEGNNVITAAKQAGIEHLVYSSGAAAEPGKGIAGSPKMQVEIDLIASGVPYTVLRPVAFMENFDGQQQRILAKGIAESRGPDRILAFISIRDIGFFVGEAFDHPDIWLDRAENIAGDRMTVREYVDTFSQVVGAEIVYTRMPVEEYLATLPKPIRPLFQWYDQVGYDADVDTLRSSYPGLITLNGYLVATGWQDVGR
jgi:uncharacterized protein YbjT (DUF2867 family)